MCWKGVDEEEKLMCLLFISGLIIIMMLRRAKYVGLPAKGSTDQTKRCHNPAFNPFWGVELLTFGFGTFMISNDFMIPSIIMMPGW